LHSTLFLIPQSVSTWSFLWQTSTIPIRYLKMNSIFWYLCQKKNLWSISIFAQPIHVFFHHLTRSSIPLSSRTFWIKKIISGQYNEPGIQLSRRNQRVMGLILNRKVCRAATFLIRSFSTQRIF
jgi:hypothetical protein